MFSTDISTQWQDVEATSTLQDIAIVLGIDQISSLVSIESICGGDAYSPLSATY